MVKYKVVLSPRAQNSLRRIYDYLKGAASRDVAVKVKKGITEAIKSLSTLPYSHEMEHDISDEQLIFRRILKWEYRIIYFVEESEVVVTVVEILHNSQNPDHRSEIFK